jgi:hypothetical protein
MEQARQPATLAAHTSASSVVESADSEPDSASEEFVTLQTSVPDQRLAHRFSEADWIKFASCSGTLIDVIAATNAEAQARRASTQSAASGADAAGTLSPLNGSPARRGSNHSSRRFSDLSTDGQENVAMTSSCEIPAVTRQRSMSMMAEANTEAMKLRVRILWAKALWYATQEAKRRRTQRMVVSLLLDKHRSQKTTMMSSIFGNHNAPQLKSVYVSEIFDGEVECQGWVYKRGGRNPAYQKRWFALRKTSGMLETQYGSGKVLSWYAAPEDVQQVDSCKGAIVVAGMLIDADLGQDAVGYCWSCEPAGVEANDRKHARRILCACETPEERHMWVQALTAAASEARPVVRPHVSEMDSVHGDSNQRINSLVSKATESSAGSLACRTRTAHASQEPRTWRTIARDAQQSKAWSGLTVVCTLWVLGGDDVYLLADPPLWYDPPMYSVYVVCSLNFVADLLMRSSFESNYPWGFFFWLDVVAILSLLPEVIFALSGLDVWNPPEAADDFNSGAASESDSLLSLARSGRIASAGSRAVRILRIVKLLKPIFNFNMQKSDVKKTDVNVLGDTSQSFLAEKLEQFITMHVIICIIAMLALAMMLTLVYGCDQISSYEWVLQVYLQPVVKCIYLNRGVGGAQQLAQLPCVGECDMASREEGGRRRGIHQRRAFFLMLRCIYLFVGDCGRVLFGSRVAET